MAKYRITIEPVYSWAEFVGWKWTVYGGDDLNQSLASDVGYWRWSAKRAAVKWARNHAAGTLPVSKTDNLDFEVEF